MLDAYPFSIILTVILFGLPVLYFIIKQSVFASFTLKKLTKAFNYTFIVQLIVGIILLIAMKIWDKNITPQTQLNYMDDVIFYTIWGYIVIGYFIYVPSLIVLNLISFLYSWIWKRYNL